MPTTPIQSQRRAQSMNRSRFASILVALAVVFCAIFAGTVALKAQEVVVSDCSSDADLRAKMDDIEAQGSGTIRIACTTPPGTILLNGTPLPSIHSDMTIIGNGVTISGNNNTAIFSVESDGALTLRGVLLTRAVAASNGGAIASIGSLTIVDSQIFENVSLAGNGGAIWASGNLTIRNTFFAENSAIAGGAIYAHAGATVSIRKSNFTENRTAEGVNYGGALYLTDGSHTIKESIFLRNQSHYGAAVLQSAAATLVVEDTRFTENSTKNGGSAIRFSGELTVRRSSFVSNKASEMGTGGVLSGEGNLFVENSTFSNNVGPSIEPLGSGTTEIRFSTIADGGSAGFQGGYGILAGGSAVTLQNTILAGNSPNCQIFGAGALLSQGNNLSSDATCAIAETGDTINTDPMLGALQGEGTETNYRQPQFGSPAIDAGVCVPAVTVDIRGYNRPAGAACDIGAVEVGATPTRYQWIPAIRK